MLASQIEVVRQGIADVRDKNHDGDTHKFFDHLDHDDDDHLTDVELMTILGADPKKVRDLLPVMNLQLLTDLRVSYAAEGEKGRDVHEDYGFDGGRNEKEPRH